MDCKLHIAYATDERYLLPTQVAVASAVFHAGNPAELVIDILDCGFSDQAWHRFNHDLRVALGDDFQLVRIPVNMELYAGYKSWHSSRGIYARLSLPDLLPRDVNWCVYADGDTLFVDDPLKLTECFDGRFALLGHKDDNTNSRNLWYETHGFEWDAETYICAGFIVLNLEWARINGLTRKSLAMLREHPDIPMNDQDVLNILCQERKSFLPKGWGVFACDAYCRETAKCIHYVGERPWELPNLRGVWFPLTTKLWFDVAKKVACMSLFRILGAWGVGRYGMYKVLAFVMRIFYSLIVRSKESRYVNALARLKCGLESMRGCATPMKMV